MGKLIIEFKHSDVHEPRPWPVGINDDNIVTSGLGGDDGAVWIGFARKGQQEFYASTRDFPTLDFENEDIVPVFSTADGIFNWDIPIREIKAIEVPTSRESDQQFHMTETASSIKDMIEKTT